MSIETLTLLVGATGSSFVPGVTSEFYPPQRLSLITPARCWSAATSPCFTARSLPLLAVARIPGMAPAGIIFSETLATRGITITSGLALGIDGVAHRGALAAEGKTIAVLGNGLSQVYPRRHATLARQIIDNGGTLVSEFPLITPPLAYNFPDAIGLSMA